MQYGWVRGPTPGFLPPLFTAAIMVLMISPSGADAAKPVNREEAFIGYSEQSAARSAGKCADHEPQCSSWASNRECLMNPYFMRSTCTLSCGVFFVCKGDFEAGPPLAGYATVDDTKAFASRHPGARDFPVVQSHFRLDPSMGESPAEGGVRGMPWQTLSSLGAGLYLGEEDAGTDEKVVSALLWSVARGWNVVDAARNYRGGRGEAAAGEALATLDSYGLRRVQLFVSTKAGYLPAETLERLIKARAIDGGDVRGGSCIAAACLQASLAQSLAAMHLQTVDLLYLHNAAESHLPELGSRRFLALLKVAFTALEKFRGENKIRAYGMATWDSFRVAPTHPGHVSLQDVVDLAREVGGPSHGFRYVQLPINAGMREAWEQPWQAIRPTAQPASAAASLKLPAVEAAAHLGLGVFASGPLGEGSLLNDDKLLARLRGIPELGNVVGDGAKLLQLARSTPFVTCTLVGHKTPDNVARNLDLSQVDLLTRAQFYKVFEQLDAAPNVIGTQ